MDHLVSRFSSVTAHQPGFHQGQDFNSFVFVSRAVVGTSRLAVRSELLDVVAADRPKISILAQLQLSRYAAVQRSLFLGVHAACTIE